MQIRYSYYLHWANISNESTSKRKFNSEESARSFMEELIRDKDVHKIVFNTMQTETLY